MIEPGRSLVGNAGVCLTEVLYLKPGEQKNFCIVDAAMNDLPRPAMYQAYHAIVPVLARRRRRPQTYDVVGPVCESGDWIGRDRALAVQPGDLLAVLSAGAYCMSMASNYNTRGRAAEVLVDGDRAYLIRERETRPTRCARAAVPELRRLERARASLQSHSDCSAPAEQHGQDGRIHRHLGEVVLAGAHPEEVQDAQAGDHVDKLVQGLPALRAQRLDGAVERGRGQRRQQQKAGEAHQDERPLGDVLGDLGHVETHVEPAVAQAGAAPRRSTRTAPACGETAPMPACP